MRQVLQKALGGVRDPTQTQSCLLSLRRVGPEAPLLAWRTLPRVASGGGVVRGGASGPVAAECGGRARAVRSAGSPSLLLLPQPLEPERGEKGSVRGTCGVLGTQSFLESPWSFTQSTQASWLYLPSEPPAPDPHPVPASAGPLGPVPLVPIALRA